VVNLLRFHEAETAMLFCATRDNVRHLHATLVERGFAAVALSGEHSQNERNQALQALRDKRARVCVATDVAARGIDVASLSLVIHVELPRDAETLQHRSGRTGRAGKKGTAILIVPHMRRRRVETMLRNARIQAEWRSPPTAEAIREQDRERLLAALLAPVEASDDDLMIADRLMAQKSPQEIAAALVQMHRAQLPAPEDLIDLSRKAEADGRPAHHRDGFDDVVWFQLDVGRRHQADPRWLLPLLCRRGHITRNEIGAIRISPSESFFQIPRALEQRFAKAVARTFVAGAEDETGLIISRSEAPRDVAKSRRRQGGPGPAPTRHKPSPTKPHRKGKGRSQGRG
ncbi:MAG: DEAD/DEAH box helicase, partial [Alphaproteobacteria bacterium]|nr:DEAD/DEAH box helicase [Alphaproteobacteria bacterium]